MGSFRSTRAARWIAPAVAALVSLSISISLLLIAGEPAPQFHDEFSYLLAADTFAHGRLTNPPHKLWPFFETFQELMQPTYASKYPPGQGLFLALGRVVFGRAIVGAAIATALASAATAWLLQARLPRRWAMLGGVIVAIHPLMLEWSRNYWGGSVAMLGGALLCGAMLRLMRTARPLHGVIAGTGVAILANSRPLEGAILSILCIASVLLAARQHRTIARWVSAMMLVLTINFMWMGYYNWRVTGNAFQLPYALYEKQYAPTRPLAWLPPPASQPVYRHAAMRDFYLRWELPNYLRQRTVAGFLSSAGEKLWNVSRDYLRFFTLALALIGLPFAVKWSRTTRWLLLVSALVILNALPVLTLFAHYTAPVTALLVFVLVVSLRLLWTSGHFGKGVVVIVCIGQIAALLQAFHRLATVDPLAWNQLRAQLIRDAASGGAKYLIIVRPGHGYYVHNEWVYNDAEIDASPIVWARDMGDTQNQRLLNYFRGRDVELMTISQNGIKLVPYPAEQHRE